MNTWQSELKVAYVKSTYEQSEIQNQKPNQNKTIHTYSMYMSGHDLIKENNDKIPAKRNTFTSL